MNFTLSLVREVASPVVPDISIMHLCLSFTTVCGGIRTR